VWSNKRPRERLANVGHFHDEEGLEYFIKVVFKPTMGMCPVPKAFLPWFPKAFLPWFEKIPSTITMIFKLTMGMYPIPTTFLS
jgi:hypothetical protein